MSIRNGQPLASVPLCLFLLGWALSAVGQQAAPNLTTPAATANAAPSGAAGDAAQRAEILNSECWRRAMFELDEWFRSQTIYTPEEVSRQRADFADQVDKMSVKELQAVLSDMQDKFQILSAPELREIRAWFGQYLSVLADRKREEVLRDIPNFATMTPAQLTQEILKIQRKKQQGRASHAAFDRHRQAQVNAQLQANRAAQTARQNQASQRAAYRSPYRPAPPGRQFEDVQPGRRRTMTVGPDGHIFMNF